MTSENPVLELMRLINGFQASQAISVIAELGIADVLKNDALHSDAIAQATECHPRSLYRLLHMLASGGFLEELNGQHFNADPARRMPEVVCAVRYEPEAPVLHRVESW